MTTKYPNIPALPISDMVFLKKLIPHREPIILIDTLQYHDENTLIASFTIPKEHLFVSDKTFSEAGLLEHMAQCVALHTGFTGFAKNEPPRIGYIGAIKSAQLSELPRIGDTVTTEVVITYSAMDMSLVKIKSLIASKHIATAEMSTILAPDTQ
ncbi:hypothetical protein G5B37_11220 [Rasiella rasia]|uniref:Uncharacterized protein n=1 Tax=Rasiella rasia TaxID=2744027 RepID=A0A6G6GQW9_9FLAO|nr:hypothetical protein [Rasiella rasia]QIE60111.1 hypothetical protein G5B37_11220 [Rasiella rasia]